MLKVGLEAYTRWGPKCLEAALTHGRSVFLDLKLHDIPNTVGGAVAVASSLGVTYLTVHTGGGPAMLRAASDSAGPGLTLLGVTLLTHLDEAELAALNLHGSAAERVDLWAGLGSESGCGGAVCSPKEVGRLRNLLPSPFVLVTPGIRPSGLANGDDDQRRTSTPAQALADGSDLLVIGRPLTQAADPIAAVEELLDELDQTL